MLNKKSYVVGIAVVIAVLLLAVVGFRGESSDSLSDRGASTTPTAPEKKITIAQFGDLLLYLPLYIAYEDGVFKRSGLNVNIVSTGGDDKTYAAVMSKSAAFGIADPTFVAIAKERGQNGRVIALLINGMPNYGVAISTSKPVIKKPGDLQGRTVASVPAPSTSYALTKKFFELGGVSPSIHQIAPAGLVASLKTGNADYAVLIEPWVSGVVREGGVVAFSLMDYFPNFALTGLTASVDTLSADPATARLVIAALREGVRIFYDDPQKTLEIAQKRFPNESKDDLIRGIDRLRKDRIFPDDLAVSSEGWQAAINLRREVGDLAKPSEPMEAYVDSSFLK